MTARKEPFLRFCVLCGTPFVTARLNRRFCSERCRFDFHKPVMLARAIERARARVRRVQTDPGFREEHLVAKRAYFRRRYATDAAFADHVRKYRRDQSERVFVAALGQAVEVVRTTLQSLLEQSATEK